MRKGKRKPLLRFSIATILFGMLCLSGWSTGYRTGYKAGDATWQYKSTYTTAYNVAELLSPIPNTVSRGGAIADFAPLVSLMRGVVEPDQTDGTEICTFPTNLSIVVTGNGKVHRRIESLLVELRNRQDVSQLSTFPGKYKDVNSG